MLNSALKLCPICSNSFTYRKNKVYCSNACKQKAYLLNKEGISISQQSPILFDFSLDEYLAYRNKVSQDMPIIDFFFLRRNLSKQATQKQIEDYMDGFCDHNFWDHYNSSPAYKRFEADYLDNKYTVG